MLIPLLAGFPRRSGFTPATLSGHVFTLEAGPTWCFTDEAGTTPAGHLDEVRCWKTKAGVALSFTNANAASTSRHLVQDGASQKWYVEFSGGAQDYLSLADAPADFDAKDNATVALACRPGAQTSTLFTPLAIGNGTGNGGFFMLRGDGNTPPNWQAVHQGNATTTTPTDPADYSAGSDVRIVSACETTSLDTHKLYKNGAEVASAARSASLPATTVGGINVGTSVDDTSRKFIGRIYGIAVWTQDHRDSLAAVDAYLQSLMP
jgi:hypothetical protein